MKNAFLSFIVCLLVFSCQNEKTDYQTFKCFVDLKIDMFPDSSFFSDIRCMQYDQNHIYILDVKRRNIVCLDDNLNNIKTTGTPGLGPQELASAYKFYVQQDTIYIMDMGSKSIKTFLNGQFITGITNINAIDKRFFYINKLFYLPYVTDSCTFAVINNYKNDVENKFYQCGGLIEKFQTKGETLIRNARNLLYKNGDSVFYAVSDNLKNIEKYNLNSLSLISNYDLSNIPLVRKNLTFIEQQPHEEFSYFSPIRDVYIANNAIYILYGKLEKPVKTDQIIKIALHPQMKVSAIYSLPGNIYESICLSNEYIFAFNYLEGTIEKIKMPDHEK